MSAKVAVAMYEVPQFQLHFQPQHEHPDSQNPQSDQLQLQLVLVLAGVDGEAAPKGQAVFEDRQWNFLRKVNANKHNQ